MAYSTLTSPSFAAPLLGSAALTVPSGLGWGPSDWVTLQADMPEAIVTGVAIRPDFLVFFASGQPGLQLELGVDEVFIGAWPVHWNVGFNSSPIDHAGYMPATIGLDAVPEGSTLMVRARCSTSFEHLYQVAATYIQKPVDGTLLVTASPKIVLPTAAQAITVTSGTPAYTTGSLATLRSASGPAFVATGVGIHSGFATTDVIEYDLFANGDRVHRGKASFGGKQGLPFYSPLRRPLDAFPLDCSIEIAIRTSPDVTVPCQAYIDGHEKPL